jgi:hypothetical protein
MTNEHSFVSVQNGALYTKTYVGFIVAGDKKLLQMHCCVSIARMVNEDATMLHFTYIVCIFCYRHTNIYVEPVAAISTLKIGAVGFSEN